MIVRSNVDVEIYKMSVISVHFWVIMNTVLETSYFFSIVLSNPFKILLNNNDVRPTTAELVESEIPQKHKPIFYV